MIERTKALNQLNQAIARSRVTTLLGPRQCGKTTLARQVVSPESVNYFDLEQPRDLLRLENPMNALEPLKGTVVIDEIQRRPELFPVLRVLADRAPNPAKFLILGSAAPRLLRQSSESLAGRSGSSWAVFPWRRLASPPMRPIGFAAGFRVPSSRKTTGTAGPGATISSGT